MICEILEETQTRYVYSKVHNRHCSGCEYGNWYHNSVGVSPNLVVWTVKPHGSVFVEGKWCLQETFLTPNFWLLTGFFVPELWTAGRQLFVSFLLNIIHNSFRGRISKTFWNSWTWQTLVGTQPPPAGGQRARLLAPCPDKKLSQWWEKDKQNSVVEESQSIHLKAACLQTPLSAAWCFPCCRKTSPSFACSTAATFH